MWEFCINIDKQDYEIYTYVYNKLLRICKDYDAILVDLENETNVQILVSCLELNRKRFETYLKGIISEVICSILKREYLIKNIDFKSLNTLYVDALVQALICFDLSTDLFIAEKYIEIEKNIDIRSIYYFKLKKLRDKWSELVSISNDNNIFFSSEEYVIDFLKFLVDNMEYKYDTLNIIQKDNDIDFYDNNQTKLIANNTGGELLNNLIMLNPRKINIYNAEKMSDSILHIINKVFYNKVSYKEDNQLKSYEKEI